MFHSSKENAVDTLFSYYYWAKYIFALVECFTPLGFRKTIGSGFLLSISEGLGKYGLKIAEIYYKRKTNGAFYG